MSWKKILIAAGIFIVVIIAAVYLFLAFYDFNKFKPMIAKTVKSATGRDLTIAGNIDFEAGIRPTLVVEDVSLQNAPWSSKPNLARVKRLEVQIAVWPLIFGNFDFAQVVLIEPDVIVEFDSAGTSNFSFDTAGEEKEDAAIAPPPLIFSDVLIEKGLFTYQDAQSDFSFSVRIDRLKAEIPGFDKSLQMDFEGAFNDIPFTLNGTAGPIWAWVEPGYKLPADLKVKAGEATANIKGEIRDPANFKDLAFTIAAQGASTAAVAKLAGVTDMPELGAFKLAATVADPEGQLGIEGLDINVGSEELVAISITGAVKDVLALQGIRLDFTAQGRDAASLTRLGIPPPPVRGAFKVSADISNPETNVFAVGNLSIVLDDREANGQLNLNLAEPVPFLTAELASPQFVLGPASLDLNLSGPFEKPAIKKLDLKLGTPELAEIRLNGIVDDLIELQGVEMNFEARGKDLANLKQLTGQPLPVRGAFSAAGKVLIPVHNNLKIPDLKMTVGKNNISGSLNLDLSGDQPQLGAELSSPALDLPSVLLPELAKEGWARGLGQVRPVKLAVKLAGFAQEIAVKKVDLRAGTLKSAELRLTGSVENLTAQRGINLQFSLRGNELARLKEIIAQPYLFAPVPGQGAYAISGKVIDPAANDFKVSDFKFVLAENELTGWMDFNLAAQPPQYEVKLSARQFNLKPFPIPKAGALAELTKINNLGPYKLHSKLIAKADQLSLEHLDLQAGTEQLAAVEVKGSIKNLTVQSGIDLNFKIRGQEIANLAKITGQSPPLKGAFAISGKLTDSGAKNYKINDLALKLGENNISGWLALNLAAQPLNLDANLSAPKFTLQPLTMAAIEPLARIEDLGPLKLAVKLAGAGKKLALQNLDLNLGREDLIAVMLKGTIKDLAVPQGMKLDFTVRGQDLANIQKLGGPAVPFQGAFNVSGQVTDPAPKIYKISSLKTLWGENDRSGWVELNLTQKRPQLRAELSAQKLDLRTLIPKVEKERTAMAQPSASVKKKDKVFPDEPLPLEGLKVIDADIKLRDKEVLFPRTALNDVTVDILLKNGNLEIKPFKFMIGGGNADVQFELRSQDTPSFAALGVKIDQLDIGPMLDQLRYQRSVEGKLDVDVKLEGAGDSIAALAAGLNGGIYAAMSDGRASSKYLQLLQKYLGTGILQLLNPFQAQAEYEQINCFVNRIEIKDGVAEVKVLLDTRQTSILAAGDVNLKKETLNLGVNPTPKKGTGVSGVGSVSFSFKELSQPFRLGGTLANPSLVVDPSRTAFTLGKFAGAMALGPAGIAAFFADVSVGKKDPCQVALQAAKKDVQKPDGKKADTGSKKEEKKKSKGFFRRLFGK